MTVYDVVLKGLQVRYPDLKIVAKSDSFLMKLINIFLIVITFGQMRDYMTRFVTTIGETIYVPDDWNERSAQSRAAVVRHEAVHIRQWHANRLFFKLKYLFWFFPALFGNFKMIRKPKLA